MKHPVDIYVGRRVRQCRWLAGMTQQQLGKLVGVQFQQIQKYEMGTNRISASRLWDIASALVVPMAFFFDDLEHHLARPGESHVDILDGKEAQELVRFYRSIPETQRRPLYDLAQLLSEAG